MNGIFKAMSLKGDDGEIATLAMKAISEVPIVGYKFLPSYIEQIGNISMQLFDTDRIECIKAMLEFWIFTCKEEQLAKEKSINLIRQIYPSLI